MKMLGIICVCMGMVVSMVYAGEWNVRQMGAVGDGVADDTQAFQKALDEAGRAGGGIVYVPTGRYKILGNLVVPGGVTLQGTFRVPPTNRHDGPYGFKEMHGSVLLAYAGHGSQDGEPFIRLAGNGATVEGLIIFYPEVKTSDVPPVPYPPCILAENVDNVGVVNCLLVNPYEGIRLIRAGRHWVSGVYGRPLWRGIYVDECYDIGRIENCHFWPFWGGYRVSEPLSEWVNTHAVAFEFARTDWQYVFNTFCFGYGVGYKFSASKRGACNGNFLGIGADSCWRAVLVEQAQPYGILITNGEFVGKWGSRDSVCVEIRKGAQGKVSLTNCSFWGPIQRCVWLRSSSAQFSANACHFLDWANAGGFPAIQLDAGRAIIMGNTFSEGDTHVLVGEKVESAIIMGNQAPFGFHVDNRAGERVKILANEEYKLSFPEDAKAHYRIDVGALGDAPFLRRWYRGENVQGWALSGSMRWSSSDSELLLPVLPKRAYEITLHLFIPEYALTEDAGVYIGSKRIIDFTSSGVSNLSGIIPPQDESVALLRVHCKGWIPAEVEEGSRDARVLGVAVGEITMRAQGEEGKLFDANSGKWVE